MRAARMLLIALVVVLAACTAAQPTAGVAPTATGAPQSVREAIATLPPAPAATVAALPTPGNSPAATPSTSGARLVRPTHVASAAPLQAMQPTRAIVTDAATSPPNPLSSAEERGRGVFNIGAPAGNAYTPFSLAVDAQESLAYVYHGTSERGPAVIAVVDLAAQKVIRLIPIGDKPLGSSNALLLTPDGSRLFLQENSDSTVWAIDAQTGAAGKLFDGVTDIALNEDGKLLFAAGRDALTAYPVAELQGRPARPAWQNKAAFTHLAVNGGRLAALDLPQSKLAVFDAATGTQLAAEPKLAESGWADSLSAGPDGGWAVVANGEAPRLIRYDGALKKLGETDIPYLNGVSFDAARKRFLAGGMRYEGSGVNARGHAVLLAIGGTDGQVAQEVAWPTLNRPDVFAAWGADRLLVFASGGPAMLYILDATTLTAVGAIPMGARVDEAGIEGDKALYVADDLDRIHVLKLPGGAETALWEGGAPLALDAANGRLYVNRKGQVAALDLKTGAVVAQFPQGGYPAADPRRDVVYIADKGVTMYDRAGKRLGDLPSTFRDPRGYSGSPSAEAVHVNSVTGHVAVVLYNNIPGSNGGTFLGIYEPQSDKYVEPPAPHSFVMDLTNDSKGNWYVAYSTVRNQEAVQVLGPDGKELRRLDRRTGYLALDEPRDTLWLVMEGRVTRLAASSLTALETFRGPDKLRGLAFSPGAANLYLFDGTGPIITPMKTTGFAPLDLKPGSGGPHADTDNYGLAATAVGKQRVLIGQFDGTYASADGNTWRRLLSGLGLQYAQITAAGDGTLFVTGASAYGGEAAWRSKDGGATWEWLAGGLTDLAPTAAVLARSADEAYFVNRSQGLLRWDPAARKWAAVSPPGAEGQSIAYSLAPDGALFRTKDGVLERSGDKGATWARLGTEEKTGQVIGYSALYTVTHTVFSVVRSEYLIAAINRSTDGGKTWGTSLSGPLLYFDGYTPQVATGFGRSYLLLQPYSGPARLLRTVDDGATWELAPVEAAPDAEFLAVDPLDGRLWLGVKGGVRSLDPGKTSWTPAPLKAVPTITPAPTPALERGVAATPTVGPCKQALTGNDAEINSRNLGLGCPNGPVETIQMARQHFQGGQMIWRADLKWIYVLYSDGHWAGYTDAWNEGDPTDDPRLTPPAGLQQPVRGFGKVWREQLRSAESPLGWATEKEAGVQAQAQPWQYGIVLRFGGEVIVLHSDGRWE